METHISIKKSLLYGAIIVALALLLFEAVARMVEFIKPPYETGLNKTVSKQKILPKQKESYRIFVYGGSTVAGIPIKQYSFVSQLEFWLKEIHPEKLLEVYNFGVTGKSSTFVRGIVEKTITYDPDLLIVLSGHNEFLDKNIKTSQFNKMLTSFALTRVLTRLRNKVKKAFFPPPKKIVMPNHLEVYDRDSILFKKKVRIYLDNIRSISKIARENDIPILLITAPSNMSEWPPVYKKISTRTIEEEYESWIAEIDRLLTNELSVRANERVHELLQTNDNNPLLLYMLAKTHAAAGNYEHARTLFTKAKDLDPMPWRVLTDFNDAIRKLALNDQVFLVDVEKSFHQHAIHGLVGFLLVADNCHPTPLGNAIIAIDILEVMKRNNLFIEKDLGHSSNESNRLTYFLSQTITPGERRSLEMNYLLLNAKYTMKTPYQNFRASRMYLDKALAVDSSNWQIWVNLATLAFFENRIEEGRQQLKKAIQLYGAPIPNERQYAPYLMEALEKSGIRLESFQ
ncbi:MAG: hypothetical protein ACYSTS_17930 [Planctomycetota bacterium]|jgi:tetratricopeptide (TPR) repeat protein